MKSKLLKYAFITFVTLCVIESLSTSCTKEDDFLTDTEALTFSTDTLTFDTVFTTMGSTVRQVKVYNTGNQKVKINAITLERGSLSRFRLNVDGDTALVARDIDIMPHDSIFIFVRVNVNPNSENSPFLIEDRIVFTIGKATQKLPLTAYGRNAVYHVPDHEISTTSGTKIPYSVIDCSQDWTADRPHVILGYAVVDEGCQLNIQAGTEVYFDRDAVLWVYDGGTLSVHGSATQPTVFTSLRQDAQYADLPGQWGYIWLSSGSRDNVIDWAEITNGNMGLLVDTVANGNPTLTISNTKILNMSLAGIYGQGAVIDGDNLLIANCQIAPLALAIGGKYSFSNSTVTNYWPYSSRRASQTVFMNNWYEAVDGTEQLRAFQADFYNCIIYGSADEELTFDFREGIATSFSFSNCILKTQTSLPAALTSNCITNKDPKFKNTQDNDFRIQNTSPAIGKGNASYLKRQHDLNNKIRQNPPSIGAYEYCEDEPLKARTR